MNQDFSIITLVLHASFVVQLVIAGLHLGTETATRALLAPISASARRISVTRHSFIDAMLLEAGCSHRSVAACATVGIAPQGALLRATPFVASSHYFAEPVNVAAITTAMHSIDTHGSVGGGATIQFDAYGGAINRVAPDATAFVHRNAACSAQYASFIGSGKRARHHQWIRDTRAAMEPFSNGEAYQNYTDDGLVDAPLAYYGSNLVRLRRIQQKYDRTNIFS